MRPKALVTGAARRVGRAVVLELSRSGFDVAIHYRSSESEARKVAQECAALGADAFTIQADLGTVSDVRKMADAVVNRWGALDVLVNNASLFEPVPFQEITEAQWDEMFAVNLRAPFVLSQSCMGLLKASSGLVVHLCDIGGDRPMPGYAHYSVSKSALIGLVKAMAVELGPEVRTVGISPGHVVWPEDWSDEYRQEMLGRIPLNRVGKAEDVGKLVRFLFQEGCYINGDVIAVDGGLAAQY